MAIAVHRSLTAGGREPHRGVAQCGRRARLRPAVRRAGGACGEYHRAVLGPARPLLRVELLLTPCPSLCSCAWIYDYVL